ncbi:MFS transporter [Paraburkholderia graminis]|uniref:MFS transporter n=1 Tax=Paraburkholderia graminis TaxID=60548 RepID=UPI0038BAE8C8
MKSRMRWHVLFLVFLISTVSYLDRTNLSVAAPVIRAELGLTPTQLGVILSAFSIAYTVAQIPVGMFANWLGPRKTYFYGMWSWCILLAATTTATSFGAWVAFRIPFGIAEAVTWPASAVLLSHWFPRVEYSQASSLQNVGLVLGSAIAPPIVSFLVVSYDWKMAFIVTGLMAGVLGTIFFLYTRDDPADDKRVSKEELEWIRHDKVEEVEEAHTLKGFNVMLMKRPSVWAAGIACFGLDFINYLFLAWYPSYLTEKYHMSMTRMGVMAMQPFLFGVVSVIGAGWIVRKLVDRGMDSSRARKIVIFGGLFLGTIALFVTTYVEDLYVSVTAMSFGYAFVMSILGPMWSTAPDIGGKHGAGFVCACMNFIGNIGGIISPILMGMSFQYFQSFTPAIMITAAVTLTCAFLFLLLYRVPADRKVIETFTVAANRADRTFRGVGSM